MADHLAGSYETIRLASADGVATITLDRPDRLNAFTERMLDELVDAFDRTDDDDRARAGGVPGGAVGAVGVAGRGGSFCAGADLEGGGDIFARAGEPFSMERHPDGGGVLTR